MSKDDSKIAEDTNKSYKQKTAMMPLVITGVVTLIIGSAGGFFAGSIASNSNNASNPMRGMNSQNAPQDAMGGFGEQMSGGFGTVTAVADTSITIKSLRSDTDTTYTITSTTTVTDGTETAKVSDITVGDRVMVQTDDSGDDATTKTATTIQINPTMSRPGSRQ